MPISCKPLRSLKNIVEARHISDRSRSPYVVKVDAFDATMTVQSTKQKISENFIFSIVETKFDLSCESSSCQSKTFSSIEGQSQNSSYCCKHGDSAMKSWRNCLVESKSRAKPERIDQGDVSTYDIVQRVSAQCWLSSCMQKVTHTGW